MTDLGLEKMMLEAPDFNGDFGSVQVAHMNRDSHLLRRPIQHKS